jgi:cytochrome c-type biogenesis protein CcmH
MLWIVFAAMAALAIGLVVAPLLLRGRGKAGPGGRDTEVYRDQLESLEAEVSRGLIDTGEAEAARNEISRRLLAAASEEDKADARPLAPRRRAALGLAMSLFVAVVATGGYLVLGSPWLPGMPLAARQAKPLDQQDPQMLLARIEAHLQANPEDGRGWDVIAPYYLKIRRFEDAAAAYSNALRLQGESAGRLSGLGEALTQSEGGTVTADARDAFARALVLEPSLVRPRFYLAMALEQQGQLTEAEEAWRAMLADAPEEAPWRPVVLQRLAAISAELGRPAEEGAAEQEPAGAMPSVQERQDMINQMVSGLAERLARDGRDLDGWLRLMRSYSVLGRTDDARQAAASARENFAGDADALAAIDQAERELGLEPSRRDPS